MDMVQYFKTLYGYNQWAHQQMWACVMQLSDEQFTQALDYSVGSIHNQCVHIMSAENMWLKRIQGIEGPGFYAPADYPTREAVREQWDHIRGALNAYLDTLTEAELDRVIEMYTTKGHYYANPVWQILMHLANHGTDHRAQVLAMIHSLEGETAPQDVILFLRQGMAS